MFWINYYFIFITFFFHYRDYRHNLNSLCRETDFQMHINNHHYFIYYQLNVKLIMLLSWDQDPCCEAENLKILIFFYYLCFMLF